VPQDTTDIVFGWFEAEEAIMEKTQERIVVALEIITERMSYRLCNIDSDNSSEFINHQLFR
jgi:hypothetical protein